MVVFFYTIDLLVNAVSCGQDVHGADDGAATELATFVEECHSPGELTRPG